MDSILNTIKKILGLAADYTAFDVDIITHINAVFAILAQMGVGPSDGFFITDSSETWDSFDVPEDQLNKAKTYIFLKVRFIFDPPTTSFAITAMEKQIAEFEYRLKEDREVALAEEVAP